MTAAESTWLIIGALLLATIGAWWDNRRRRQGWEPAAPCNCAMCRPDLHHLASESAA